MIAEGRGGPRDYEFLPSGPLKDFLERARLDYGSWEVLCELTGLGERELYRIRSSDYVSIRVADIIFIRIGNSSFYEFYDDDDILSKGELTRSPNQKIDNSADAQRRRERRVLARAWGDKYGMRTRYVLEYIAEFWSDKRLNDTFDKIRKTKPVQCRNRVLSTAEKLGLDLKAVDVDDYADWADRSHWLQAARFQRMAAPRVWGRCMIKLGGEDVPDPMTPAEAEPVSYTMDELAQQVVIAAQVYGQWRWAFYVLRSLELCGWTPAAAAARRA